MNALRDTIRGVAVIFAIIAVVLAVSFIAGPDPAMGAL